MTDWREAKKYAEEQEAAYEVAAWLVVLFVLPFLGWAAWRTFF
jgi:hypothetical protein